MITLGVEREKVKTKKLTHTISFPLNIKNTLFIRYYTTIKNYFIIIINSSATNNNNYYF